MYSGVFAKGDGCDLVQVYCVFVIALGTTNAFVTAKHEAQSTKKNRRKNIIALAWLNGVSCGDERWTEKGDTFSCVLIIVSPSSAIHEKNEKKKNGQHVL
jgi:hypothetical protein